MPEPQRIFAETDWLPVGEEPQPLGSITHCCVLRYAGISVLSEYSGAIDGDSDPSTGMYVRDTRHLSRLRLTFAGIAPILLDASSDATLSAIFTNPALRSPGGGETIRAQSLVVRRTRAVAESLLESLNVSNYGFQAVTFSLRIEYGADFADIFDVRGYERTLSRNPVTCEAEGRRVHWEYLGADGHRRTTTLEFNDVPASITPTEATFEFHLAPRETCEISFEVAADGPPTGQAVNDGIAHILGAERQWLSDVTHIETDHDGINAVLRRSLLDIHALRTQWGDDRYLAAGVPWFDTLFGRDSLIAGMELLPFAPAVLRDALTVLARYQADTTDPKHDATPGKIPHELRWGELANSGEVPFGRYYGSVDATPLFVLAAWQYLRWTDDQATLREIWPALQRAIGWCRSTITSSATDFLCYMRHSSGGLENQGWKDSHDAIIWPDGAPVQPPIALIEVQAYYAAALTAYARLAEVMGETRTAALHDEAAAFCQHIDDAFGDPSLGYALCLDAEGRAVATAASNAGHMLWARAARKDLAQKVALRLMQDDLFSGWGVRTLSTSTTGYNPLGYHVGSVWPHDNALILSGMRWYGLEEASQKLGTSLIQMALSFPGYQVPELFSGDARRLRSVPTPYPVASRPQAWAAASMPSVFASMLGIHPGAPGQLCIIRPVLPTEVKWLQVRNLRFGRGSADLSFRRTGTHVSVEVERLHGGLEVMLSQSCPDDVLAGPRNPGR
jgi:glycogen debranching enzyme